MAKVEIEGQTIELAEDWRVGELIRAENALDIDMESAKTAARTALVLYISLARLEEYKTRRDLADFVMRLDISSLTTDDEEDDALPPVFVPDAAPSVPSGLSVEEGKDDPPTTGHLRSASSG